MNGDFPDRNAGILAAASISAYSMSSPGPGNMVTGRDILLTAFVDDADYEEVRRTCSDAGAL